MTARMRADAGEERNRGRHEDDRVLQIEVRVAQEGSRGYQGELRGERVNPRARRRRQANATMVSVIAKARCGHSSARVARSPNVAPRAGPPNMFRIGADARAARNLVQVGRIARRLCRPTTTIDAITATAVIGNSVSKTPPRRCHASHSAKTISSSGLISNGVSAAPAARSRPDLRSRYAPANDATSTSENWPCSTAYVTGYSVTKPATAATRHRADSGAATFHSNQQQNAISMTLNKVHSW